MKDELRKLLSAIGNLGAGTVETKIKGRASPFACFYIDIQLKGGILSNEYINDLLCALASDESVRYNLSIIYSNDHYSSSNSN